MMHQDSLEPAAIRFMLGRLQESARRFCISNGSCYSTFAKKDVIEKIKGSALI